MIMMLRIFLEFLETFFFFFKVKKKEKLNVIYDGWMKKKLSYIWTTYVDLKFCQSNYEKNISTLEEEKKK